MARPISDLREMPDELTHAILDVCRLAQAYGVGMKVTLSLLTGKPKKKKRGAP